MITTLAVENYRSLRRLVVPLDRLTVVTGGNGVGKSALYRALRLLADSARDGAVAALAREGGLRSALWAGEPGGKGGFAPREDTTSLRLGFAGDEFGYAVDFGHPQSDPGSMFALDPEIKRESVWSGPVLRPAALLSERHGPAVRLRAADPGGASAGGASGGAEWTAAGTLRPYESMLAELADPHRAPELLLLRETLRSWRFYDHVRTDAAAPARAPRVGTRTPVLAADGADLAAALQTIREIGDPKALDDAVDSAFPGSRLAVTEHGGHFEVALRQPGVRRPLRAAELSDGTLRYLLWAAALLSPRPPALLVLNEPETSLHPELLPSLADLVRTAAERTQTVVVTHAAPLAAALASRGGRTIELVRDGGPTAVRGQGLLDEPAWHWPGR
ncbi:AAA family ATPase [Streptomyces durbertensis]|uniref:AAA family ATPase n=1 Tax=Streptomyces durbertensis TaxID=2448886 RepID=A0ABR6EP35_9ACTN|nr:AAA family ATPase [Streptomyces durbertensis]MBB1247099.1 AAA family ATPase [Streptomyces durbertensis]